MTAQLMLLIPGVLVVTIMCVCCFKQFLVSQQEQQISPEIDEDEKVEEKRKTETDFQSVDVEPFALFSDSPISWKSGVREELEEGLLNSSFSPSSSFSSQSNDDFHFYQIRPKIERRESAGRFDGSDGRPVQCRTGCRGSAQCRTGSRKAPQCRKMPEIHVSRVGRKSAPSFLPEPQFNSLVPLQFVPTSPPSPSRPPDAVDVSTIELENSTKRFSLQSAILSRDRQGNPPPCIPYCNSPIPRGGSLGRTLGRVRLLRHCRSNGNILAVDPVPRPTLVSATSAVAIPLSADAFLPKKQTSNRSGRTAFY